MITSQQDRRARVCQPGNREWVTIVEAIQSTGRILPPMIIFAGQLHQKEWYDELPPDWVIGTSPQGWINNDLSLLWLKEIFHKHTKDRIAGVYRLLVLDGHKSHATADFDHFCKENKIIPLYLPPHSSHILQPLDVTCFGPLKRRYGSEVQSCMAAKIHHIDKKIFLDIYKNHARPEALTNANAIAGFAATGLVPYKPERVLDNLHFRLDTPTPPPPGSSHSDGSSWTAETPKTTKELIKQSNLIKRMWRERTRSPPSPLQSAIDQVVKSCNIAMSEALLLKQELSNTQTTNNRYKRKRDTGRIYLQNGGILTGEEGQQRGQEEAQLYISTREEDDRPRKRAPPTCSICHKTGHIRSSCVNK